MSAIPPTHVPSASLLQQSPTRKSNEWPALSPSKRMMKDHNATNDAIDESWEMLPDDDHDEVTPQTSFCVVEPLQEVMDDNINSNDDNNVEKRCSLMHHCQSTPDFHNYETILDQTDIVEAVLIEEEEEQDDEEGCDGSSSMVMVSGPPSVLSESCWSSGGASSSSKISFRDAIMKKHTAAGSSPGTQEEVQPKMIKKKKPKFVVSPIKRCAKSTGDLRSLARIAESNIHQQYDDDGGGFGGGGCGGGRGGDEIIVGETDAELFYNQKAKGKVGRKNGKKIRPDEKKRLVIIMAKKDDQRQRQQQSQPSQAAEKKGKKNKKDELK
jgi:hypothetical protein